MTSNQYNTIFTPIIRLFRMKRSEAKIVENFESSSNKVVLHDELRAKILERIEKAQAKNKDLMLSREEAAIFLNVKIGTLAMWKSCKRYGLPYIKVGRYIRYRSSDLIKFLERNIYA